MLIILLLNSSLISFSQSRWDIVTTPKPNTSPDPRIEESNAKIAAVDKAVEGVKIALNNHIDKQETVNNTLESKIKATDTSFNKLIKESIDKLPQRLLSEEAKKLLKEAILIELRSELQSLRSDLQKQIDALKERKLN